MIGDAAKNQLTSNPENTVFDAKRLIGRTWSDSGVQSDIKYFPFKVVEKNTKPHVLVSVKGEKKVNAMKLGKLISTLNCPLASSSAFSEPFWPACKCPNFLETIVPKL